MQKRLLFVFTPLVSTLLLSQTLMAQNSSPYWSLAGNSNATTSSKLGTTNAIPLRILTNNVERMRLDANGKLGIGTTAPAAPFDLRSTSGLLARFTGGSKMYMALYEGSTQRGYFGSFAGNAQDVDFGTNTGNLSGRVHLTTKAIPRLSIDSIGRVGIGTTKPRATLDVVNPTQGAGIQVNNTYTGNANTTGVEVYSVNAPGSGNGVMAYGGFRGVYGEAQSSTYTGSGAGVVGYATGNAGSGLRYGVFGQANGGINAYGVFGAASGASSLNAAGYFNGAVWASSYNTISDRKFKQDITAVEHGLEQVLKLRPTTYTFKIGEYKGMHLPEGRQVGLIADEVKEVFPELVSYAVHPAEYDKEDRTKVISPEVKYEGVNYQGFIPVLIASIQEQQQRLREKDNRIAVLESGMAELRQMVLELKNGNANTITNTKAALEQNAPNPAGSTTIIRYHVPQNSTSSVLTLSNAKGQVIKTMTLNNRGAGQLSLNTQGLASGTYHYILFVDGNQVDTKRLVIVR